MKTDKELAVELAASALQATALMQNNQQSPIHKPLSGSDIRNILTDCYSAVRDLESDK